MDALEWLPDKVLAAGSYGRVVTGTYLGVPVAVKLRHLRTPEEVWRAEAEVALLARLKNEACVATMLHGMSRGTEMVTVLELCEASAAENRVGAAAHVYDVVLSICSAFVAMHGLVTPVVHRRLTLNCVLGTKDPTCWKVTALESSTNVAWKCVTQAHVAIGYSEVEQFTAPSTRPPELLDLWRGMRCDQQIDMWGLGTAMYELLYRAAPFDAPLSALNRPVLFPDGAAAFDISVIEGLLAKHPSHRPDAWTLARRLLDSGKGSPRWGASPTRLVERPRGWREMPLAPWCDTSTLLTEPSKLIVSVQQRLAEPHVAPDTPTITSAEPRRQDASAFDDVMDVPIVDDFEETVRTHLVTERSVGLAPVSPSPARASPPPAASVSPQVREGREHSPGRGATRHRSVSPQRNVAAKVKDWVERKGISSAALTLFHQSNTLHAWVIRATDDAHHAPRLLYADKLRARIVATAPGALPKTMALLFHYLSLRPVLRSPIVAYKAALMLHRVLHAAPTHVHGAVHGSHRSVLAEWAGWWGSPLTPASEASGTFPLVHSIAERYAVYLLAYLRCCAHGRGLTAGCDEEAAELSAVYIAGVQLLKHLLREAGEGGAHAGLFCPAVVRVMQDMQAVRRGIDAAPQTGTRMSEVAPEVRKAAGIHDGCVAYAKVHLPETLLAVAAAGGVAVELPDPAAAATPLADDDAEAHATLSSETPAADPSHGQREFEAVYLPMFVYDGSDSAACDADVFQSITQLAAVPGNDLCFDCATRPVQYGSSLGVFLCSFCEPFHAEVPADRTKSIFLDPWDAAEIDHMRRIGNARAKLVWLGRPDIPSPPDPIDDAAGFQEYIQRKYVQKAFVGDVSVLEHRLRALSNERAACGTDLRVLPGASPLREASLPAAHHGPTPPRPSPVGVRDGGSPHNRCLFPVSPVSPPPMHTQAVHDSLDDLFAPSSMSSLPHPALQHDILPDAHALARFFDPSPGAQPILPPPVTDEPSFVLP